MKAWKIVLALALGSVAATVVVAAEEKGRLRLAPNEIKAPAAATTQAGTSGAAGLQMGLLSGNPKIGTLKAKHASATTITVRLDTTDELTTVSVVDDGVGFATAGTGSGGGAGLSNMRDRIDAVGGAVSFVSAPGRGTRVIAKVPSTVHELVS